MREEDARRLPTDPIERIVAIALNAAGIRYEHTTGGQDHLDFFLPDLGVQIECKQFHAARVVRQMSRHPDVIVIQGRQAAHAFAAMVTGTAAAAAKGTACAER